MRGSHADAETQAAFPGHKQRAGSDSCRDLNRCPTLQAKDSSTEPPLAANPAPTCILGSLGPCPTHGALDGALCRLIRRWLLWVSME